MPPVEGLSEWTRQGVPNRRSVPFQDSDLVINHPTYLEDDLVVLDPELRQPAGMRQPDKEPAVARHRARSTMPCLTVTGPSAAPAHASTLPRSVHDQH